MAKGCLIVCDGNNGAGKSSVILAIKEYLEFKTTRLLSLVSLEVRGSGKRYVR